MAKQMGNIPGGFKAINEARKMQKQMSKQRYEVEEEGIRIVMSGDFQLQEMSVDGEINERVRKALNKAFKKVNKEMAKNMMENGDLGELLKGFGR